jgi:outer membrane protein
MNYIVKFGILAMGLVMSGMVWAHGAGDITVRAGFANVSPNESSDPINVAGLATLAGVNVGSETQLGLTVAYMVNDNVGVELLAATPFKHAIDIKGAAVKAGTVKQLPPTLSVQYYFGDASSAFRPYLGLGLNTTIFFSEKVDPQLNAALDTIIGLPAGTVNAGLELDQSWGLAAQAGFDYQMSDGWWLNAAVWYIDINTTATVKTAVANVSFDVDIDPAALMVGIGYTF